MSLLHYYTCRHSCPTNKPNSISKVQTLRSSLKDDDYYGHPWPCPVQSRPLKHNLLSVYLTWVNTFCNKYWFTVPEPQQYVQITHTQKRNGVITKRFFVSIIEDVCQFVSFHFCLCTVEYHWFKVLLYPFDWLWGFISYSNYYFTFSKDRFVTYNLVWCYG